MYIEGSEIEVLPYMIFAGSLQHINTLMIEWHTQRETVGSCKLADKNLQSWLSFYSLLIPKKMVDFIILKWLIVALLCNIMFYFINS